MHPAPGDTTLQGHKLLFPQLNEAYSMSCADRLKSSGIKQVWDGHQGRPLADHNSRRNEQALSAENYINQAEF